MYLKVRISYKRLCNFINDNITKPSRMVFVTYNIDSREEVYTSKKKIFDMILQP